MSVTHGGISRSKRFNWHFDTTSRKVRIENEDGREHSYSIQELYQVLTRLHKEFRDEYFPLANNVELLSAGTEKMGLGTAVLQLESSDVYHAQGSSYLGVVLEECGYFAWNGRHVGIMWRLLDTDFSPAMIESRLIRSQTQRTNQSDLS